MLLTFYFSSLWEQDSPHLLKKKIMRYVTNESSRVEKIMKKKFVSLVVNL